MKPDPRPDATSDTVTVAYDFGEEVHVFTIDPRTGPVPTVRSVLTVGWMRDAMSRTDALETAGYTLTGEWTFYGDVEGVTVLLPAAPPLLGSTEHFEAMCASLVDAKHVAHRAGNAYAPVIFGELSSLPEVLEMLYALRDRGTCGALSLLRRYSDTLGVEYILTEG